ncbi:MAG: sensor histidine kinase [Terriglobia bacterium]
MSETQRDARQKSAELVKSAADRDAATPGTHGDPDVVGLTRRYQELVEFNSKLQEETQRRTIALATAAHRLKTPLAIISGYIEVLQSQKPGALAERQLQILEDARENCERLQRFVQDFLTYSALETGSVAVRLEVGDIQACLIDAYELWLPRFQKKGVALYLASSSNIDPFRFDSFKVEEVVSNVLDNSLKFTPPGGSVWVSAEPHFWQRRTRQDEKAPKERRGNSLSLPNSVQVSVADTGPGIEPEYHQEIFTDFFRIPRPDESPEGTGLGLAIARRLVHAHGGKIWVESEPGAGCKVSFLLPFQPEERNGSAAPL